VPTARAIPSSLRRSAASITKIRKMSRIPAAIENDPNVVKNAMNAVPVSSASAIASCFAFATSSPSGPVVRSSSPETRSESRAPPTGPPRFETSTCLTSASRPSSSWACASGSSSAASAVPVPSNRTTSRTRNTRGSPTAYRTIREPRPARSASPASSFK
jgi:hypothetical protein